MHKATCRFEDLLAVARIVWSGGLVIYPTDTVYGLGCDPFNSKAVDRVFEAKGRGESPLPVLCASRVRAERLVVLGQLGQRLAARFWPGPLTLVAPLRVGRLPARLVGPKGRLGVRVPDHRCALELIELSGGYLVGTSANRSGAPSPTTLQEALESLGPVVDAVVEGGPSPLKVPSTVVAIEGDRVEVLREGVVGRKEVFKAVGLNPPR